jgi:hypothetical protein
VEVLEKCALAYLLALIAERKVTKIPLVIRELAFAKLRKDQEKVDEKKKTKSRMKTNEVRPKE